MYKKYKKCITCGKTKNLWLLRGNFKWFQCWNCLEIRAQEEMKKDGFPFANKKQIKERRLADILTFNGKKHEN